MTSDDRSTRILLVVDSSNFEYMCIHAAARRWEKDHADEAKLVLKELWETDQDNLPELLNYDSFRRTLNFVVQDKLELVRAIVSRNHPQEVDFASGMDVVFTIDDRLENNFRKKLYPDYKAQRKKTRQRFQVGTVKAYIHDVVFQNLGLEDVHGYKLVKVEGCESDDLIAAIMNHYTDYMCRILISSDKDFLQLRNVNQYDTWGKKVERTIRDVTDEPMSRSDFLLWKIIRGDASDNIKNVFPKYGDKKCFNLVHNRAKLREMLEESNAAAERYKLNSVLIDFRRIPESCIERIISVVDAKLAEARADEDSLAEDCMVL